MKLSACRVVPIAIASIFALVGAGVSLAAGLTFTNRSSFEATVGSVAIEEFENAALVGNGDSGAVSSLTFSTFSVSSVPNAVKLLDTPYYGAGNSTPAGRKYLYIDTDMGNVGSVATFITLSASTFAFGFDYTDFDRPGSNPVVTISGQQFSLPLNPGGGDQVTPLFWGYVGSSPFMAIAINSDCDSAYGIDRVTTPSIPEPSSLLALLTGIGGLMCRRRR
jgi:hypothetical protein